MREAEDYLFIGNWRYLVLDTWYLSAALLCSWASEWHEITLLE